MELTVAHKYMIRLHDIHNYELETADATTILFGDLTFFEDGYKITYKESEGDLAGCTTVITCKGGTEVSICRTGPYCTDLYMEVGKRHNCQYETEFGSMLMGVFAESVASDMTETGGTLDFTYNLDIGGDFVSRNTLHITVKETF